MLERARHGDWLTITRMTRPPWDDPPSTISWGSPIFTTSSLLVFTPAHGHRVHTGMPGSKSAAMIQQLLGPYRFLWTAAQQKSGNWMVYHVYIYIYHYIFLPFSIHINHQKFPYGGFLMARGTPSHHPFFRRLFHEINHPAIGVPPFMETTI